MMWFRLAEALGLSVAEAQRQISSAEFVEWIAYYQMVPLPEDRADLRAAMVAMSAVQPHSRRRLRLDDFMLKFRAR